MAMLNTEDEPTCECGAPGTDAAKHQALPNTNRLTRGGATAPARRRQAGRTKLSTSRWVSLVEAAGLLLIAAITCFLERLGWLAKEPPGSPDEERPIYW